MAREPDPARALLDHACSVLGLDAAAVLRAIDGRWCVEASAGAPVLARPKDADIVEELAPDVVLELAGPSIPAEEQLVLNAVVAQLAVIIERAQPRARATEASTDVQDGQPLDGTQPSSGSDPQT